MLITRTRIAATGLAAAAGVLIWALPATARPVKAHVTVVNVVAGKPSEFKYILSRKSVPRGTVIFKLTDKGALPHDFKVCASPKGGKANVCKGTGTTAISPGGTATLKVTFKTAGNYEYLCTIPGHAAAGMKGILKVT